MHEALGDLEEVTVWLIWRKVDIEHERIICTDFLSFWLNFEGVLHELSSCLIEDWKKSPIN